jgi:hypothetical protein
MDTNKPLQFKVCTVKSSYNPCEIDENVLNDMLNTAFLTKSKPCSHSHSCDGHKAFRRHTFEKILRKQFKPKPSVSPQEAGLKGDAEERRILHIFYKGTNVGGDVNKECWDLIYFYRLAEEMIEEEMQEKGNADEMVKDFTKQLDFIENKLRERLGVGVPHEVNTCKLFNEVFGSEGLAMIAVWGLNVMTLILLGVIEDDEMNGFVLEIQNANSIIFVRDG